MALIQALPTGTASGDRRRFLFAAGAAGMGLLWGGQAGAQAPAAAGDTYKPTRGQAGKDVIWVPTPDALVTRMLQMAQVTPQDFVMDLGSGDGKIVLAAAREFGARGLGIEYNPDMVALSQRRARELNLANRVQFEQADIFETDISRATVVTMYLLPGLNLRLRHRLLALKPGTRVVSHSFLMGKWEPDETASVGGGSAYLWLVPANAGGEWELQFPQQSGPATARLNLTQTFQTIHGDVRFDELRASLRAPQLMGEHIRFALTDADGRLRHFEGRLSAPGRMAGTVSDGTRRSNFSAIRHGDAPPIGGSAPAREDEQPVLK